MNTVLDVKVGVVMVNGWMSPVMCKKRPPPNPFVVLAEHDVKFRHVKVSVPPVIVTNIPPPLPFDPEHGQDSHVTFVNVVVPVVTVGANTDPFPIVRVIVNNTECWIVVSFDVPTV